MKTEKMKGAMAEGGRAVKEGNTTPASTPRGYPDMGDCFVPKAEKMMGNAAKLPTDTKQMPAQRGSLDY